MQDLVFVGSIFPKPSREEGNFQKKYDSRSENTHIPSVKFQLTPLERVKQLHMDHDWLVPIEIQDAYWHISINPVFRDYLGFIVELESYHFKALPSSLSLAPKNLQNFNRLMVEELETKGIHVLANLDERLVWAPNRKQCAVAIHKCYNIEASWSI